MQELELHSRQRLGTSHQDGILVWDHFDRDGGRGSRLGAPLLLLIAASLEAIKVGRPRRDEQRDPVGGATCPRLARAEMVQQKRAGSCRVGDTNNVNVTPSAYASKAAGLPVSSRRERRREGGTAGREQGRRSCQDW